MQVATQNDVTSGLFELKITSQLYEKGHLKIIICRHYLFIYCITLIHVGEVWNATKKLLLPENS